MENELFEKTKVSKAYMTLALPVVLGMVVSLIYNMVDTFFIARTGNTALIAGVSLGTPIFTLMIALGDIFGVGGSSVISRLFGKKEYEDGRRISVFCFYAAIAVGIVVSIILLAAKQPILGLLGCDETTWQYAGDYYQWIALGAPFIIVQLTPNNLVRTEGFAKASMIGTMIGAVVNIILDPVFIYTLGLGAAGAAIATVLGNICGDIFYVIFIIKKCRYLSVDFRKMKVTGAEVLAVLAIGIPASVTNFMQSIGVTLTNRFLQPYGTDKVAAMGIALKIIMISVLVMVGFAFGGQPLVGYNYGAKNKKRFNETIRFAFLLEVLTGAGMAIVLGAAAPLLVGLFLKDASVIAVAQQILRVQLIAHRHAVCRYCACLHLHFPGDWKWGRRADSLCRTSGRDFCHCHYLYIKDRRIFRCYCLPAGFGFPDGACGSDDSAAVEEKSTCRLKILKKAVKRLRSEFPGWEPAAAVFAHAENKTMCPRQKHVKVTKNRHAIRQYYGIAFRENKI